MSRQEEVDIFMNQFDLDIDPEYRALDVAAEFGEVAAEMLAITEYGDRQLHTNENLEKEFGDLYFSLIALANKLNIDLDAALDQAMEKYKQRIQQSSSPSSQETRERQQQVEKQRQQEEAADERSRQDRGQQGQDVIEAAGRQPDPHTSGDQASSGQEEGSGDEDDEPWDVSPGDDVELEDEL